MFNQRIDVEIQWKIKTKVWVVIFMRFMVLQEWRLFEIKVCGEEDVLIHSIILSGWKIEMLNNNWID